ncbi:MAG: hypothetical protein DME22_15935 [Verrucomicrobia bacterium]|nr:MAG: hypothetical protein DME22_15935 [Verrucomicrobiota bacterium]
MKFLGFYPEAVVARAQGAGIPPRVPKLGHSLFFGAGGFCVVGVAVFAFVAATDNWLRRQVGEVSAYAVYALLFILLAGALFRRLVIKPAPLFRCYILFALAFLLYSAAWTAAWVSLRNKPGEWLASLVATTALGLTLAKAFDAPKQTFKVIAVLFVTRSAGYFVGEFLHHAISGLPGWLLWGAVYGLGLGGGLGYTLYACQELARERLKTIAPHAPASTMSR